MTKRQTKNGVARVARLSELIDDFLAEYPATTGEPNTTDSDEVITAVAKTAAELTSSQDGAMRQNIIEIMNYGSEFRQQDTMGTDRSHPRH